MLIPSFYMATNENISIKISDSQLIFFSKF